MFVPSKEEASAFDRNDPRQCRIMSMKKIVEQKKANQLFLKEIFIS